MIDYYKKVKFHNNYNLSLSDYIILLLPYVGEGATVNNFTTITQCLCPQHNVTFECTVTGGIFTVWNGNAFQCINQEIILRNSDFGSNSPPTGICMHNDGQIFGEGISQENNSFTSRLSLNFTEGMVGRTVNCIVDGASTSTIGSSVLEFSTSKLVILYNVFSCINYDN